MAKPRQGATRQQESSMAPSVSLRWMVPLLLAGAACAAIYLGVGYLLDPSNLPVRSVRLESPLKQVTKQQLRDVIGTHVQQGFLRVDVDAVRHNLEAMPWIYKASVRRGWPDILVIRIEEREAVARWEGGALVSRRGELFQPGQMDGWSGLPLLSGPEGTEKAVVDQYKKALQMLTPLGLRVSHLAMDKRRAWNLELTNGLQVVLGRNDTHLRMLRFVRVYAGVLKPRLEAIDGVDLRYTNGFAVRWQGSNEPAAV